MVTFALSSSPEQITVQNRAATRLSRVPISPASRISGKRLAIDTLGSSADFAIYQPVSLNGLDPNKDVTLLSIAGNARRPFRGADRMLGRRSVPGYEKTLDARAAARRAVLCSHASSLTPDLTVPESVVEEWIAVGTLEQRKKSPPSRNRSPIGRLSKEPAADHQSEALRPAGKA